ncbi:KAP family P-loop domain-containing protein [Pedobacter suwonensis]|uniref:KAP family P-loop domain-containing protein n=1 Tax=Pedobacter suwonensis TaxID=332999 RepID=A0A1I0SFK9_9SPHI|nr:P-loop NTPase fold protein [Pedobacter suwonensis]SFA38295.1 KAP family P-loop domain-containing protein [Pedobacter suwonensis]
MFTDSVHNIPKSIKTKFDGFIVLPLFGDIESNTLNSIMFSMLAIISLVVSYGQFRAKKALSADWSLLFLFVLIAYVIIRWFTDCYEFMPFSYFGNIKYTDVVILICLEAVVLKTNEIYSKSDEPVYLDEPFLIDLPILGSEQDLLNRQKFAVRIANKIQSLPNLDDAGSLAIGITGEWGSGKTSFNNLIEAAIDKENRIIIKFNPWRSSSSEKIIEDFFSLLIAELKPYDQNLSNSVYAYARTLTKIDDNILTKIIQYVADLFERSNKNEIYDSINKSLVAISKQIIIFIDDLDRLDKKEIAEVLRIIRNTGNFNKVVYVVAYDKDYVLEGIKSFNESNHQAFLEKIFQFEFALPLYRAEVIRHYLKTLLRSQLPEGFENQVEIALESRGYNGVNFTSEIIETHRGAIRLVNALSFEIKDIIHDVFFYDFYLLQLLKTKFPKVFKLLFDNYQLYFVPFDRGKEVYHRLRKEHERNVDDNQLDMRRFMRFGDDGLRDNNLTEEQKEPIFFSELPRLGLSESQQLLIRRLIFELLDPDRETGTLKNERYKVFAKAANFYKYFAFELLDGEIPSVDFENSRRNPYEKYLEEVIQWTNENKFSAVMDRLNKIEIFETLAEFENHIKILFEIGRWYSKRDGIHGYDKGYLLGVMLYPMKNIEEQLSLYGSMDEYITFLKSNFIQDEGSRAFENLMINYILSQHEKFPISNPELSKISLENLKRYTLEFDELSSEFWNVYHSCKVKDEESFRLQTPPEAQAMMREFYKTHTYAKDLGKFIMQTSPESEYYYIDKARWEGIFDSIGEFEEWFNSALNIDKTSTYFGEFISFYNKSIPARPNGIKWDFKYITPDRWR